MPPVSDVRRIRAENRRRSASYVSNAAAAVAHIHSIFDEDVPARRLFHTPTHHHHRHHSICRWIRPTSSALNKQETSTSAARLHFRVSPSRVVAAERDLFKGAVASIFRDRLAQIPLRIYVFDAVGPPKSKVSGSVVAVRILLIGNRGCGSREVCGGGRSERGVLVPCLYSVCQ